MNASSHEAGPVFTRAGILLGARLSLPVLPGLIGYCVAFGAAAAHTGLSWEQSVAMSALVYAGAAQLLSLELWREVWTPGALLTVGLVTATVNARYLLMSASLQPWMRGSPVSTGALNLFLLTDANWLIATRYHGEGGRDLGVLFGAGFLIWIVWIAATLPGYFAGVLVGDPRAVGIDLVMPIFFSVLAVPLWKGVRQTLLPWIVAGTVATLVEAVLPGYAFIVAGALSGAVAGALARD